MRILSEIKSLIKEANESYDINRLIDINLKISGYLFYVQEDETEAHKTYLDAYNERKTAEASYCIKSDLATNKAEKMALIETRELKQLEIKSEVIYQDIRGKRQIIADFTGVLTQKISCLRREFELKSKQV